MYLKKLALYNFKNYTEQVVNLSSKVNCFVGENGAGKTNILDAIYLICFTKSYFNTVDSQLIKSGGNYFRIESEFENDTKVVAKLLKGKRKAIECDGKSYKKLSEHIGKLPVIMICPDDSLLITGNSDERRKLLDVTISQTDKGYLESLTIYNKVLTQRNALLKQYQKSGVLSMELLQFYNQSLIEEGTKIYNKRAEVIIELQANFYKYYDLICDASEKVNIEYASKLNDYSLEELFTEALEKDKILGRTTTGIHKDDLKFSIFINDDENQVVKKFGSQGQQKTFLMAIKFAQYDYIKAALNLKPLMLIDDLFDKLDKHRGAKTLQLLTSDNFGQIFVTDTSKTRIITSFHNFIDDTEIFEVSNGKIED